MFYSYFFDGDPEDLDGLPNAKSFVILSQGGFVRCVEKDVSLSPTVRIHVERRVIYGDRHSMVHCLLRENAIPLSSFHELQRKLIDEVKPGCPTYVALTVAQGVIVAHFEEAIAFLIDSITDDNHTRNVSISGQIRDIYGVLAKFNPRYQAHKVDWQRKTDSYRAVFCREEELVTVTLR